MAAHSATSRKPTSAHVSSDDMFLVRAAEFSQWARANVRLIVGGAVVLALVVGGLIYYRMYREDREARAAAEYLRIEQTAASGNAALAARDLQAFARRYEGLPLADEAQLALAQIHLNQKEPAKAVEVLRDAPDRIEDSPVGPSAALLLAAAQDAAGDRNAAIQTYLAVAEESDLKMYKVKALNAAAVLRADAGDYAGAAELFRQLVDLQEEGTADRQLFEMRLAEIEAQAAAK